MNDLKFAFSQLLKGSGLSLVAAAALGLSARAGDVPSLSAEFSGANFVLGFSFPSSNGLYRLFQAQALTAGDRGEVIHRDAVPASRRGTLVISNWAATAASFFTLEQGPGWRLAPTNAQARQYPRLVNYQHMTLPESQVNDQEERLASWDVIILNPDSVQRTALSLKRIRTANPNIKVLVWMPLGQSPDPSMAIFKGLPPVGPNDWYCRAPGGAEIVPVWGGHFMDPYTQNQAWPRYAAGFVATNYLQNGLYDGVLFDILAESDWMNADLNGDGVIDSTDNRLWQQGQDVAVETLRALVPSAWITGNGGVSWSASCPYFGGANGDMRENALGNEFGNPSWNDLWSGYQTAMTLPAFKPALQFIVADVRWIRSYDEASALTSLTLDDLRRMRLGLTSALLREGYFGFDRGDSLHGQLWWFDEYDADLGPALGSYAEGLYGAGLYSRTFQKGLVIVNPTSNPASVRLPAAHRDATTHHWDTSFLIPAMDGRILLMGAD